MKKFELNSLYGSIANLMEFPLIVDAEVEYRIIDTDDGRSNVRACLFVHYDLNMRHHLEEPRLDCKSCVIQTFDTRVDALAFSSVLLTLPDDEQLKLFVRRYSEINNLHVDTNYGEW